MQITTNKLMIFAALALLIGCESISVPIASKEQDAASKQFQAPLTKMSGIYIYRNSSSRSEYTRTIKIDNAIIGKTASYTYFHVEIPPGVHTLSTQSEYGDNLLTFTAKEGKNYYFRQYMKLGVFNPGSNLEAVNVTDGQEGVLECNEIQLTR